MEIQNGKTGGDAMAAVREFCRLRDRRAFVLTFGCQQNEADSERLRGLAVKMGYRLTDNPEEAELILVNTCAIREHAELKALSVIGGYGRIRRRDPDVIIGVCGCMAAEPHRIAELKNRYPYVSFTLEPGSIPRLPEMVAAAIARRRTFTVPDPSVIPEPDENIPVVRASGYRAWVSIMYGCNNFCTYCIVPYVRGRERSRSSDAVYEEVRGLVADGVRDITLLGQNVNSYRSDTDFAGLLRRLDGIGGDFLLRFMTSHPKDVSDGLIRAVGECVHVAPQFHLPLQSGSDTVLARMNRRYTAARYRDTVSRLRAARPGIAITSDIIVGFPGETEEDFSETLACLRELRFDMIYSFIYSPRKGTPAAEFPDQVPPDVAHDRMNRLLALADEIAIGRNAEYVGRRVRVLVDAPTKGDRPGILSGRTDTGKLVHFPGSVREPGRFTEVVIDRAEPYALIGTKADESRKD